MTKKDFIVIAKVLKMARATNGGLLTEKESNYIVGAFIGELMKQNPRFDAKRFEDATA